MFKKFRGGHLIDEYQKAKQIRKDKKAFQRMIVLALMDLPLLSSVS